MGLLGDDLDSALRLDVRGRKRSGLTHHQLIIGETVHGFGRFRLERGGGIKSFVQTFAGPRLRQSMVLVLLYHFLWIL